MPAGTRARSVPTETSLPQQVAQDGSSCVIKNPLHTRVITFFKDKNYNYFLTSRFNAEHIFTAIDDENFTEDSSKRLTTKILQVRHSRRKFLSKVRVTNTEGNPAQGPLKIQRGKFRYKGPSSTAPRWKSRYRSDEHCSNEENIYYNLLPTVYYYNYILFIFSQVKYTNTTRDRRIQGEHRRSGASFLQALTCLNFFDFQIFEYLSFNNFSIVIENLPESNGYPLLSMTWKL